MYKNNGPVLFLSTKCKKRAYWIIETEELHNYLLSLIYNKVNVAK